MPGHDSHLQMAGAGRGRHTRDILKMRGASSGTGDGLESKENEDNGNAGGIRLQRLGKAGGRAGGSGPGSSLSTEELQAAI